MMLQDGSMCQKYRNLRQNKGHGNGVKVFWLKLVWITYSLHLTAAYNLHLLHTTNARELFHLVGQKLTPGINSMNIDNVILSSTHP